MADHQEASLTNFYLIISFPSKFPTHKINVIALIQLLVVVGCKIKSIFNTEHADASPALKCSNGD